jgi:hypothetical protein
MGKRALIIAALLLACSASGATWYIDRAATNGAKSGRDWPNAWTNTSTAAIGWSSIQPGDTVYVAGGNYTGSVTAAKSGTASAPITFKASQEQGKNGLVYQRGSWSIGGRNWLTLDGAKDDTATNVIRSTMDVFQITNGWCNWRIVADNAINYGSGTGPNGIKLKWLEISTATTNEETYGIRVNAVSTATPSDNEWSYLWIHHCGQDGIHWYNGIGSSSRTTWGNSFNLHHSFLNAMGDDGIECTESTRMNNCIIGRPRHLHGHPDGIQCSGGGHLHYLNIIYDQSSSEFFYQASRLQNGNIFNYGNLVFSATRGASATKVQFSVHKNIGTGALPNSYWTNWVFANNTVVNATNGSLSFANYAPVCTNRYLDRVWLLNNAVYNWYYKSYLGGINSGTNGGWFWGEPNVEFNYNVLAGAPPANQEFGYLGTKPNAEAINAATGYKTNTSRLPSFRSPSTYDYRPSDTDRVLRDTGTNWSALAIALGLPDYNLDLYGNVRGADGAWDRGAFEYAGTNAVPPVDVNTNSLLVYLDFEDDFTATNRILDKSPEGLRPAWRYGRTDYPTNYPTQVAATNVPGRVGISGYAGSFSWWNDGFGEYGKSGQYAAITNSAALTNLPQATIMLWGKYNRVRTDQTSDPTPDHSPNNNATFLSGGYNKVGAWEFGRDGGPYTEFMVTTNGNTFARQGIRFPDQMWSASADGDTTNWHHYAVTFASGNANAYYDGVWFTNFQFNATHLSLGKNGSNPKAYLAVGCRTHNGTPSMSDVDEASWAYPNNGWLDGYVDEVRVYGAALSASEISGIVATTGGTNQVVQPPPPTPQVPPFIVTQPISLTVDSGQNATFTVAAGGTAPLRYAWRRDGTNILSSDPDNIVGDEPSYTITADTTNDSGSYACYVDNLYGAVLSATVTLTVNPPPVTPPVVNNVVVITSQPASATVTNGNAAAFSVGVTGTAPITYQWRKGGVNIGGATASSYSIASVTTNSAAQYSVAVSNAVSYAISSNATLNVYVPPPDGPYHKPRKVRIQRHL